MVNRIELGEIARAGLCVLTTWGIYSTNDLAGKLVDYPIGRGIPGYVSLHKRPSKLGTLAYIVEIRKSKSQEIYIEAEINNPLDYTEIIVNCSDVLGRGYNVLKKDSLGNITHQSKTINPASVLLFKKELDALSNQHAPEEQQPPEAQ